MDLKVCGGAYDLEEAVAIQECINMFPELEASGSKARIILRRFPGLKAFSTELVGKKIRGMEYMNGTLYVVADQTLYSVSSSGVTTSIGTIEQVGRVSMAHGWADDTSIYSLVIVNGTGTGYVYNETTLSTISDTDFEAADLVLYLDTYFVFHKTNTSQFFISEAGSATSYIGTDIATKEGNPGKIVSMITSHRDLILFGEDTTETWRNTGNTDFPFQRQEGTYQERGAIGLRCPAEMDNTVYYLGDDRVVYALAGYRPTMISHHAIEKWLDEQDKSVLDEGIGMTITHQGHYWYILSFSTGTWVYDATTSNLTEKKEWFQLESWEHTNWRVTEAIPAYGRTICSDDSGYLYTLDAKTLTENGTRQLKRRTTPFYQGERKPISCPRLELAFKQGVANASVTDPSVMLEISRDWGRTWGSRRVRSLGKLGEYIQKAVWRRNGHARGMVFRWSVTDDVDVTITGGFGEFTAGVG